MNTVSDEPREIALSILAEIAEVKRSDLHPGDRLREDLGMDSLSSLELLSSVAERLRVDVQIEEAMGIRTVADACAFVEEQWRAQR